MNTDPPKWPGDIEDRCRTAYAHESDPGLYTAFRAGFYCGWAARYDAVMQRESGEAK